MLAYLRVIVNPGDTVSLLSAGNVQYPRRVIAFSVDDRSVVKELGVTYWGNSKICIS